MEKYENINSELLHGIEIEKEHRDLYLRIKSRLESEGVDMPISEYEFYETIAKAHLREDEDYYRLLLKYIEKEKMAKSGIVNEFNASDEIFWLITGWE